ncbi:exonuclease SbcCD subunit D C-terminal domain-containing protein [Bacteroides sp.]|uniref:exonuclease SbcCD subunit D C-terminal domain-containing protein n=1 Tax=Bacteroides sp. TaxID=29523 RepID=UPI0026170D62|nr:exonuclease SbcCD subunit D C-terminal domain-containing protein [Bacteroides sp.]MDD3037524.1 exonuclease SbcCD subunit D C-terminal domain-containing protein [Bacteroides sp.]
MIRILHTADWHLGQTFFGYDRTEEHKLFLDWLAKEIHEKQVEALIVAGDVFDVSNPSATSQRMYYQFIYRVTTENPNLQIVIVAGNHDSAARLEAPLPLLQAMRTEVRGVVRKLEGGEIDYDHLIVDLKNRQGEVELLCMAVPFLRQGDYPVVQTDGNAYAEGVRKLYTQLLQRTWERRKESQAIMAIGHLQATGSEIAEKDYSERTVIGGLECVSPDAFSEQIAYTALGHIHKAQRVSGRENVRYSGSPIPMSFAEKYYHHGVVMVTFDDGCAVEIERLECPKLISLLSVPNGEAELPESVLKMLRELPEVNGEAPYLEVKVLLEEPEPMFPQQVAEVLTDKNYRLARIVSTYRRDERKADEERNVWNKGLLEMSPLQIAQSVFEKSYQVEMPDELTELFQEVYMSATCKQEEEEG